MKPLSFVIDGSGWRAMFFVRVAKRYPEQFELRYMLCRSEEKAEWMRREYGIPTTTSRQVCIDAKPDFVVTAVTRPYQYPVTKEWALCGFPVLGETPAGETVEELKELWELHTKGKVRIQTAEQYHRYPIIAAGLKAIREGKLGDPYEAVLSVAHDYHGASMLRCMLCTEPGPMTLRGISRTFPVRETGSRFGAITDGRMQTGERSMVSIEYGTKKHAYYDFSSVQYHSSIRSRHINVQGQDGEWNDTTLRYVDADYRPKEEQLTAYLDPAYRALYTEELKTQSRTWKPYVIMDDAQDEFAIATMLFDMRGYLETGREVYPMAEALEDAYTFLLIQKAVAAGGAPVESERMPWHQ